MLSYLVSVVGDHIPSGLRCIQFYVILRYKGNFKLYCRDIYFEFMKLIINVHIGNLFSSCQTEMFTKLKYSVMN
jgi:hypothetical protein